jgi:methylamine dehydrogenase accessory protein MauD
MSLILIVTNLVLWCVVLCLAFLLLGALRAQGLLAWRVDQLEATMPSRIGRSGLAPGKLAPNFTLPSVAGADVSLHDFARRKLLLVFTQSGCSPCHDLAPQLNRLSTRNDLQVVAINHGSAADARQFGAEIGARFPVLIQEEWSVSRSYESFATPFAFLIDERGVIAAKGIVSRREHLSYLLSAAVANDRAAPQGQHSDDTQALAAATTPGDAVRNNPGKVRCARC